MGEQNFPLHQLNSAHLHLIGPACGVALIGIVIEIDPTAPQTPAAIVPLGTAGFAMSLCLNFIVSALIVGRIWYHSRQNRQFMQSDNSLKRAAMVIVESGLLFLVAQFVWVVLFAIAHPAQAIIEPVATQIYVCDLDCSVF